MGSNEEVGTVKLRNVFVEAPPDIEYRYGPGDEAIVRLELFSEADDPATLVSVRTDLAQRVEMIADPDCDGERERVSSIVVPPEGAVNEPGSPHSAYHLRIVDFRREVLAGTTVPLVFTFRDAGEVTVDAMVEAGDDGDVPPPRADCPKKGERRGPRTPR
ncbi:uncharacterized protein DUF461 [Saccharothrix saharensis]|uniref:Uncharacterized protein DUF461 n=1 Tax=Saccharothrix saharensis TaxID=571190 RepID=A0A543JNN4_9PSEU|nr:uncharacterized protein DUF461 [Saccharothrix saharensis]